LVPGARIVLMKTPFPNRLYLIPAGFRPHNTIDAAG
jgi:hypothetical protein